MVYLVATGKFFYGVEVIINQKADD